MTISPRKREQLAAFLGSLPEAAALKLFAALEADRAAGGKELPHSELLAPLRERLLERSAVLPRRRADARRVFFTPFEDFFIGAHQGKKRRARIARTSLAAIWRLMMTHKATQEAALAAASLDDAIGSGDDTKPIERALFIAAEAGLGRLCDEAQTDPAARKALAGALGSEAALEDLEEIRRLLTGLEYLRTLQALIPSPAPSLSEEQLYDFRTLFLSAHEQSRALGAYVLLALKDRLERPWRSLAAYYSLARGADDRLEDAKEALSALPESLFEDLETIARALERAGAGELDARAAMTRARYFADYADGVAREAKRAGDNVFLNRVEACRDIAADAFDRFAEQALAAVRRATPVREGGGSSRLAARRPDCAVALSPATLEDASAAAGLIADAPGLAERLSADPAFTTSIRDDARDSLHAYAKDLIVEIRAAEGDARKAARRMFDQTLKIAAPLLDRDEIGLLRDRAAAAAVAV